MKYAEKPLIEARRIFLKLNQIANHDRNRGQEGFVQQLKKTRLENRLIRTRSGFHLKEWLLPGTPVQTVKVQSALFLLEDQNFIVDYCLDINEQNLIFRLGEQLKSKATSSTSNFSSRRNIFSPLIKFLLNKEGDAYNEGLLQTLKIKDETAYAVFLLAKNNSNENNQNYLSLILDDFDLNLVTCLLLHGQLESDYRKILIHALEGKLASLELSKNVLLSKYDMEEFNLHLFFWHRDGVGGDIIKFSAASDRV